MRVDFECRDPNARQLRDIAERRVRFATRRLAWLLANARLRLTDINGPRGGVDKRCLIELRSPVTGTIVVTSDAKDWRAAIDRALPRALRALTSRLRRVHSRERLRLDTIAINPGS